VERGSDDRPVPDGDRAVVPDARDISAADRIDGGCANEHRRIRLVEARDGERRFEAVFLPAERVSLDAHVEDAEFLDPVVAGVA